MTEKATITDIAHCGFLSIDHVVDTETNEPMLALSLGTSQEEPIAYMIMDVKEVADLIVKLGEGATSIWGEQHE
ncbi:MAG: hypothetical protein JST01_14420 [Cyanobacteria bacterium SZAS TMP-1]|nr:hypothetical protein [Cyanobacteria bacterium SZAS TMP-1]